MRLDELREELASRSPGESISVAKSEMSELPSGFSHTVLGTPPWIAEPGATAQYRAWPALHVYELETSWKIHRDKFDSHDHPVLHGLFDAPELALAAVAAAIAGFVAWLFVDRKEKSRKEDSRSWLPALAALGVAAVVGVFAYILGAMVRVALHPT